MTDHIVARAPGKTNDTNPRTKRNEKQAFSSGPHVPGLDDEQPSPPADTTLPPDVVSKIESRAEVDSLGDLHARRRQLMLTLAPLKALHGPFGLFDDRRKRMVESLKVRARTTLSDGAEKKPTESAIDATAYADPQYETFLDEAYQGKIDYLNQATELSELEERIRSREIELMAFSAEARLQR